MNKEDIEYIIKKYQSLSSRCCQRNNQKKAALYDRIAEQLEYDIDNYIDNDNFTSEEEIIEDIRNLFDTVDNFYDEEDYENMDMLD